jgi:hypothetical protein
MGEDAMSEKSAAPGGGIGVTGLLLVLFVGLKLAGIGVVATWSWWWVLSPLWIPLALFLLVVAGIALVAGGVAIYEAVRK